MCNFLQGMEFISLYKVSICNAHKNIHIALEMIKFHFKYLLSFLSWKAIAKNKMSA